MRSQLERTITPRRTGLLLVTVLLAAVSCEGNYHSKDSKDSKEAK